ncbi:MAG: hypothetical protein ACI8Q9_002201, partial [Planctomycetota bacterium]
MSLNLDRCSLGRACSCHESALDICEQVVEVLDANGQT